MIRSLARRLGLSPSMETGTVGGYAVSFSVEQSDPKFTAVSKSPSRGGHLKLDVSKCSGVNYFGCTASLEKSHDANAGSWDFRGEDTAWLGLLQAFGLLSQGYAPGLCPLAREFLRTAIGSENLSRISRLPALPARVLNGLVCTGKAGDLYRRIADEYPPLLALLPTCDLKRFQKEAEGWTVFRAFPCGASLGESLLVQGPEFLRGKRWGSPSQAVGDAVMAVLRRMPETLRPTDEAGWQAFCKACTTAWHVASWQGEEAFAAELLAVAARVGWEGAWSLLNGSGAGAGLRQCPRAMEMALTRELLLPLLSHRGHDGIASTSTARVREFDGPRKKPLFGGVQRKGFFLGLTPRRDAAVLIDNTCAQALLWDGLGAFAIIEKARSWADGRDGRAAPRTRTEGHGPIHSAFVRWAPHLPANLSGSWQSLAASAPVLAAIAASGRFNEPAAELHVQREMLWLCDA